MRSFPRQLLGAVSAQHGSEHPATHSAPWLVRWGTEGLAFRDGTKIYILRTTLLAVGGRRLVPVCCETVDSDTRVKLAVYHYFAQSGLAPLAPELATHLSMAEADVLAAWTRLRQNRVLWLEPDGRTIRMAPPFSAIPTQHRARVDGKEYFANCAWDALGIPAALRTPGTAFSRCEQSGEPLELEVRLDAPPRSDWLFHCLVPAAHWWKDLPFT